MKNEAIWFRPDVSVQQANERSQNTLGSHLGIEFTRIGPDFLEATMPIDHRTTQPMGILHGGASVALAESLASTAGSLTLNPDEQFCVGLEINANHIRSVSAGLVTGTSKPLHRGKSTQVWETTIRQNDELVCISRMTLAVLSKKKK